MKDITKTEINLVSKLVKSPETDYNANNLAKATGITAMGAMKILKKLENEMVLESKKIGKTTIYRISDNPYAKQYVSLILAREAIYARPSVKRWIEELKKIKNATIIILHGSILQKPNPNDIDVVLVTEQRKFLSLQKEIKEINEINVKKIHAIYQTLDDMVKNIKKKDKPLLNAIKGIIVTGVDRFIGVYNESRKE